ncbi:MAG: alpha/beta hydrolase [Christensenellales bacterium]
MHIQARQIHPQLRAAGVMVRALVPQFRPATFRLLGALQRPLKGHCGRGMRLEQVFLPRPAGSAVGGSLRLCVYRPPEAGQPGPGILWLHGGGYALGLPEQDRRFIRAFVRDRGCTLVAPDYCLSTRAPYPAALEDAYLALRWLQGQASRLQVRQDQIMIGGNSAGGGLCAALAILARDRGEVAVAFQMPLFPMLDDRTVTPSARDNDAPVWNTRSNRAAWRLYLGPRYGGAQVPPYAAPARLEDFRDLPPAFSYVGALDPFLDETLSYMAALRAAGVQAECQVFQGCFHGFDILLPRSAPAREARALLMARFDRQVADHPPAKQKAPGVAAKGAGCG